jgi:hypothetical protein
MKSHDVSTFHILKTGDIIPILGGKTGDIIPILGARVKGIGSRV